MCGSLVVMQKVLGTVNTGVLVVHGAGAQLDKALAEAGLPSKKVNGLRFTDDETYAVVEKETLALNHNFTELLKAYGANALAVPRGIIHAESMGAEYGGRVGKPVGINHCLLSSCLSLNGRKVMPVAKSLGVDYNWAGYNVNADDAAAIIVAAVKPELLLCVTSTGGILADVKDPKSVVQRLTLEEAAKLSSDGMLVKVEAIKAALTASPKTKVVITSPTNMVYSLFKTAGTTITYS